MKRTLLLLIAALPASAQVPLRGLAYDSLHGKPLAGAFVGIVGMNVSAVSDSAGRFVFPAVPKGTHRVVMQHDVLDAIGLSAAGARAVVNDEKDSVIVAVPSFGTLWRAACGRSVPPGSDSGFVFGTVQRGGQAVPLSVVTVSWLDLSMDSSKAVRQKQKVMEVDADSSGNFSLCGVPTTTGLSLRANLGSSFGVWTDIAPLDKERIARRDLTIVAVTPMRFDVPQAAPLAGRVQRDSTNAPVADAEVSITDVGITATTNERGEFRFPGVAPGRHSIQVRKIGYSFQEQTIDVAAAGSSDLVLQVSRITTLDSMSVTARNAPVDEGMRVFEEHRKLGVGKFMTREDLAKMPNMRVASIVGQWPGIKITFGPPGVAWLLGNSRGKKSIMQAECEPIKEDDPADGKRAYRPCPDACYPRIFVDGVDISKTQVPNVNRFITDDIEGIEYYAGGGRIPAEYNVLNSRCGVLVLLTRAKRAKLE